MYIKLKFLLRNKELINLYYYVIKNSIIIIISYNTYIYINITLIVYKLFHVNN
jgi:hypothetical protein